MATFEVGTRVSYADIEGPWPGTVVTLEEMNHIRSQSIHPNRVQKLHGTIPVRFDIKRPGIYLSFPCLTKHLTVLARPAYIVGNELRLEET